MAAPHFARRVARIPELLAIVAAYPDGLSLGVLAERFGVGAQTIREDLTTYLDLESWGWSFDIFRRSQIEFVPPPPGSAPGTTPGDAADDGGHADRDDPASTVVRVVADDPAGLGVEHLAAGDLAIIYTAGSALLDVEPDDDLAAALGVIAETMYGGAAAAEASPGSADHLRFLAPLREACAAHRRVRIVYSRAWREGVLERVVEPLRLLQTHRGWELDAGPVGPEGSLRTYLLTHLRDVEPLTDSFEPPHHVEALLADQRRTTTVRVEVPHEARWAADVYAERVVVVEDREATIVADLALLAPVGARVGLLLLAAGPTARVLRPGSVLPDAAALIGDLLRHHEAEV